jgi:benzylsuccinate CoA-transferase BbsE subunit
MNNTHNSGQARALEGIRVLEVGGAMTQYCGKMFAELGADVILIEPPEGASIRRLPPFIADRQGPEDSLAFAYFNTSKKGVTLDLTSREGQEIFRRMAAAADLVIESEKPGTLERWGCSYSELSALRPSIVLVSITGFGQTGPYAHYETEDLIGLATGGFLYLGGYPDAPPVGAYGGQAFLGASMYGAVAAMLALTQAELTGQGDHVDVSLQECMVMAMETAVQFYDLEGKTRKRHAGEQRFAGTAVFECQDGYIYMMASGIGANKFWSLTLQWLRDEKVPGVERLMGDEWNCVEYVGTDEAKRIFAEVFSPWVKTKTKSYLYHEGQRRHIPLAAINTIPDILQSAQLAYRKYFVDVVHPAAGVTMRMPGAPYKLALTPWQLTSPAPRLGEHNIEVYEAVGLSRLEIRRLAERKVI